MYGLVPFSHPTFSPVKKPPTNEGSPSDDRAPGELRYVPNSKHSDPWQPGRRGSLCPREVRPLANDLLNGSEVDGYKRYALHAGKAYCAQEHRPGLWHGYPVGWVEVPERLRRKWRAEGKVSRHDIRRYWD